MRSIGVIKWFGGYNSRIDRETNFGFIKDPSDRNVFLHENEWGGAEPPSEGEAVCYKLVKEDNGRWKATSALPASSANLGFNSLIKLMQSFDSTDSATASVKIGLKNSLCKKFAELEEAEIKKHAVKGMVADLIPILSSGPGSRENIGKLIDSGLAQPMIDIPADLLPQSYFNSHEADFAEHLDQLSTQEAKVVVRGLDIELPVTLLIYLIFKNVLVVKQELGIRYEDVNQYIQRMFLNNHVDHPQYLQDFINSKVKPKGGLRSNELMTTFIDIALFKTYLYEKNPKFADLYHASGNLQSRADIFILNTIFSLLLSNNDQKVVYTVFLQQLWKAIFEHRLRPREQAEEILGIFPSCGTLKGDLSCEAVFWPKQDKLLCRAKPCQNPRVFGEASGSYFDFTIYDWFAHYSINYLNNRHPFSRDFPIKVAAYLNRVREIFDVIHCRCCGYLMLPDMRYSRVEYTTIENGKFVKRDMAAAYRLTVFKCPNSSCQEYEQGYYISHCVGDGCEDIIDTRDLQVQCDNGLYVCRSCGSCCEDHAKSNPVGLCPECGSTLKLFERAGTDYRKYKNRIVTCSSNTCHFRISSNNLPKKFYSPACGKPTPIAD